MTQWLNNNFGEKWIGRYGPFLWPARSPDLNPCDFFLVGTNETRTNETISVRYPVDTIE
jgi:hypothetical protein